MADHNASPQMQALSVLIKRAIAQLESRSNESDDDSGLLFLGNWQDAIPRQLITDAILEPVDKITWQVIRIHVSAPGSVTAFPSYEAISNHANIRSNHTISRALAILRATRWLSLCARVRRSNGRYVGNIYVLHDEPVTLGDALFLDSEYMAFLNASITHKHRRVRWVTQSVLATIEEQIQQDQDPISERVHTRVYERRIQSFSRPGDNELWMTPIAPADDELPNNQGKPLSTSSTFRPINHLVQNLHTGESPLISPVQKMHSEQNLHTAICSSSNKYTTTTNRSSKNQDGEESGALIFPDSLSANEKELALIYLSRIDQPQQQDVLDEWQGRLLNGERRKDPIANPIGYLASLCRRVDSGEFQLTIGLSIRETRITKQRQHQQQALREAQQQKAVEELTQQARQQSPDSAISQRIQRIRSRSQQRSETDE